MYCLNLNLFINLSIPSFCRSRSTEKLNYLFSAIEDLPAPLDSYMFVQEFETHQEFETADYLALHLP